MSDIKKILIASAVIIVALALSFVAGQRDALNRLVLPQEPKVDTLFIFDTIVSEKPIYKEKRITERILVPVTDTIRVKDTLYLYAEKEQIHWKDSLSDVYASGIDVNVDSVLHYVPMKVVTETTEIIIKMKPKWSIGVHAGYGAFANNGQIATSPYIGVGVSYNLFSW